MLAATVHPPRGSRPGTPDARGFVAARPGPPVHSAPCAIDAPRKRLVDALDAIERDAMGTIEELREHVVNQVAELRDCAERTETERPGAQTVFALRAIERLHEVRPRRDRLRRLTEVQECLDDLVELGMIHL